MREFGTEIESLGQVQRILLDGYRWEISQQYDTHSSPLGGMVRIWCIWTGSTYFSCLLRQPGASRDEKWVFSYLCVASLIIKKD